MADREDVQQSVPQNRPVFKEVDEIHLELSRVALDAQKEEYRELIEMWKGIETKAQGNIAIAGIFFAGLALFLRHGQADLISPIQAILIATVVALVSSVIFSMLALYVSGVAAPPVGDNVNTLVHDLRQVDDQTELNLRYPLFFLDQLREWRIANPLVEGVCRRKASRLLMAQYLLLAAIVGVSSLLILKILGF